MLSLALIVGHVGLGFAISSDECGNIWDPSVCDCMVGTDGNTVCAWSTVNHVCAPGGGVAAGTACTEAGTHVCSSVSEPLTCACTEGCFWAEEEQNGGQVGVCLDGVSATSATLSNAVSFPLFIPDVNPRIPSYVCRCRTLHSGSQHTGPQESCHHEYPTEIDMLLATVAGGDANYLINVGTGNVADGGSLGVDSANVLAGAAGFVGPTRQEIPSVAGSTRGPGSRAFPAGCANSDETLANAGVDPNFGTGAVGALGYAITNPAITTAQGEVFAQSAINVAGNRGDVSANTRRQSFGCCTIARAHQTLSEESLPFVTARGTVDATTASANFPSIVLAPPAPPVAGATSFLLNPQDADTQYTGTGNEYPVDVTRDWSVVVDPTAADFVNPFEVDVFFNNDYRENANPFTGAPMTYGCGGGAPILAAPATASANAITYDDGAQFRAGGVAYADVALGGAITSPVSYGTPYTTILGTAAVGNGPAPTGPSVVATPSLSAFRFPTAGLGTSRWRFTLGTTTRLGEDALRPLVTGAEQLTVGGINDGFGLSSDNWPGSDEDNQGDIGCQCGYHRQTEASAISVDAFDLPTTRQGARPLSSNTSPNGWTCTANTNCASGRCEYGGGLAGKVCVPSNWPNMYSRFEPDDSSD